MTHDEVFHVVTSILGWLSVMFFAYYGGRISARIPLWEVMVRLGLGIALLGAAARSVNRTLEHASFEKTHWPILLGFLIIDLGYGLKILEHRRHPHCKP